MPRALDSLAIWPILSGLLFIFRSVGIAYNEVVLTLIESVIIPTKDTILIINTDNIEYIQA